jgi:hypothetical protein
VISIAIALELAADGILSFRDCVPQGWGPKLRSSGERKGPAYESDEILRYGPIIGLICKLLESLQRNPKFIG